VKRLFLDANVLFTAAHNPTGKASLVIELGVRGQWDMVTSSLAVKEAKRNLSVKFPDCLPRLEVLLNGMKVEPSASGRACPIDLPEKDRPIFLTAVRCKATHLVTGDVRHFGPFMKEPAQTGGMIITTVADLLEVL